MSDSNNPFTRPEARNGGSRGATVAWCIAVVMTVVTVVLLFLWSRIYTAQQRELESQRTAAEKASGELANALAVVQTNQGVLVLLKKQVADLQREKEQVGQRARTLEEEMRQELESKDVTISKLQGKLTVTIVDRVMFDSGEAVLKPDGAAVMQKIADLLAAHPELSIHVVGHTDNVPIRQTAQSRFASNWELSAARALAAVHFLTEKAGVDPRRVGAVGYGEFRPIADNATAEGRAKNRRIAITVLPEEFATSDAIPAPANPEPTNSAAALPPAPPVRQ
jgi:chemotaxis protein MotB